MIDQNNKIIQELKNRPINENGSVHVARQNNYDVLIKNKTLQILDHKKTLKFENYVEWLENEVLYQTYQGQWKENQRKYTEERLLKTEKTKQYLTECLEDIRDRIIEMIDEKEKNNERKSNV